MLLSPKHKVFKMCKQPNDCIYKCLLKLVKNFPVEEINKVIKYLLKNKKVVLLSYYKDLRETKWKRSLSGEFSFSWKEIELLFKNLFCFSLLICHFLCGRIFPTSDCTSARIPLGSNKYYEMKLSSLVLLILLTNIHFL